MCAARVPDQGKVIRVGVLQDGKIVLERRLDPGESLTVGNSPGATVSCPLPSLPRRYPLREAHRGRSRLRVPRNLKGKLSVGGEVLTLDDVRARPPSGRDRWDLELDDRARGSIRLGELTLLFQLVQAPPVAMRQLVRPSFRPKLMSDDDPVFVGFLSLFTVMAGAFAAYVSTVQTPELIGDIAEVERFASIIIPAPEPTDPEPVTPDPVTDDNGLAQTLEDDEPEPEPEPTQAVAKNDPPPDRPLTAQEAVLMEAERKEGLREQVYEQSALIRRLVTRGDSPGGLLDPNMAWGIEDNLGTGPERDLDQITELTHTIKGVDIDGTGREDADIELTLAEGGQAGINDAEQVVPESRITTEPGDLPKNSPDATRIYAAIKGYYPRVKTCYERRLKEHPNLRGRVEIEWIVDSGKALDIFVVDNTTDDLQLEQCIETSIRNWRFPADVVGFPVSFPFVLAPG